MHWTKGLLYLVAILLLSSLFFPWVGVESRGVEIGGFSSRGTTSYGKPGLFQLILTILFIVFISINRVWTKRVAFFMGAMNIAWAARNFILISACSGGICPEKYTAIYVLLFSSIALLVLSFFVDYNKKVR